MSTSTSTSTSTNNGATTASRILFELLPQGQHAIGDFRFRISHIDVSLANAIRRVLLSDIPVAIIRTDKTGIAMGTNTSRYHDQFVQQRLGCIPVFIKQLDLLPGKYQVSLDMSNRTDELMLVTTEHFKIIDKSTGEFLDEAAMQERFQRSTFFPKNDKSGDNILFAYLAARVNPQTPPATMQFVAEFGIATAKEDSRYNVTSSCAFMNTIDTRAATTKRNETRDDLMKLKADNKITDEEIQFRLRNFDALDAQRIFVANSFDFTVKSIVAFSSEELVALACTILYKRFAAIRDSPQDKIIVKQALTTMDAYDVVLLDEDQTIGNILTYYLFKTHYEGDKILNYCAFTKIHPHDTSSTIRLSFAAKVDNNAIISVVGEACALAMEVYKVLHTYIKTR